MSEAMDVDNPGSRGLKRKADDCLPTQAPKRIKVINSLRPSLESIGRLMIALGS